MIRKLAVIRENDDIRCPFLLPISQGCRSVGNAIDKMQAVNDDMSDEEQEKIKEQNLIIWGQASEPGRCKYAAHLFKQKPNFVDCNFGQIDAGVSPEVSFSGSPYYTQIGELFGIFGLYSYPLTYHTDGQEFRNLYYGLTGWATREERLMHRVAKLKGLITKKE